MFNSYIPSSCCIYNIFCVLALIPIDSIYLLIVCQLNVGGGRRLQPVGQGGGGAQRGSGREHIPQHLLGAAGLLGLEAGRAERVAAAMITEGRLRGFLDQTGMLYIGIIWWYIIQS